jgi:hypothetical protein
MPITSAIESMAYRGTRGTSKKHLAIFAQYGSFVSTLERAVQSRLIGGQGGFKLQGMHLTHT